MTMHIYKIHVAQTGKTEEVRYFNAYTAADALVHAKVFFDWQFNGAYEIHMLEPTKDEQHESGIAQKCPRCAGTGLALVDNKYCLPCKGMGEINNIAWIREALDVIKERHGRDHSGGCRIPSQGDDCPCTLCLCDKIRDYIENQARKA